jgi:release factor glutamine methyltransferase
MTDLADQRGLETDVYQPAEDSELLASVAREQVDAGDRVLEIGTGSGYVAEAVVSATGARTIASDLNPHACRAASERGLDAVRADLVAPFRADSFDVVLCNPPYLPTDPADELDDWMEVALSGGESGLAVIEPLLATVSRVLRSGGCVLLLVSSLTDVDAVVALADEQGFGAVALDDTSFPYETLTVLKLVR